MCSELGREPVLSPSSANDASPPAGAGAQDGVLSRRPASQQVPTGGPCMPVEGTELQATKALPHLPRIVSHSGMTQSEADVLHMGKAEAHPACSALSQGATALHSGLCHSLGQGPPWATALSLLGQVDSKVQSNSQAGLTRMGTGGSTLRILFLASHGECAWEPPAQSDLRILQPSFPRAWLSLPPDPAHHCEPDSGGQRSVLLASPSEGQLWDTARLTEI
jgi:hypothetical protein